LPLKLSPTLHNLGDVIKTGADLPVGIVGAHLAQFTDVKDVIANPVFIPVLINLGLAGMLFKNQDGLQDRAGVRESISQIIHLRHPRASRKPSMKRVRS
jgi:hypothetical protein